MQFQLPAAAAATSLSHDSQQIRHTPPFLQPPLPLKPQPLISFHFLIFFFFKQVNNGGAAAFLEMHSLSPFVITQPDSLTSG